MARDKAPEITLPKSFHIPEGDGEDPGEFDAVCTFKSKGSGKYCLIQIGDQKFDYEEPEPEEEKPDYKDLSKSMVQDMNGLGNMTMTD